MHTLLSKLYVSHWDWSIGRTLKRGRERREPDGWRLVIWDETMNPVSSATSVNTNSLGTSLFTLLLFCHLLLVVNGDWDWPNLWSTAISLACFFFFYLFIYSLFIIPYSICHLVRHPWHQYYVKDKYYIYNIFTLRLHIDSCY